MPVSGEIRIVEKPEWIGFDALWALLIRAHEENAKNGLKINTRIHSGEELRAHMGAHTVTWVALDGENVVGTISARIEASAQPALWGRSTCALMHLGVDPQRKGQRLGARLCEQAEAWARRHDAAAATLFVVDRNPAQAFYRHIGYEALDFVPRPALRQNSVLMVKWLKESPVPGWRRKLRFRLKRSYIRLRYRFR